MTKVTTEVDEFIKSEQGKSSIDRLTKEIAENNKIFNSIQKTLDLIYSDRDLLKDIYAQGEGIKALILALDKHNELITKDVQQSIIDTKNKVEEKSEETKDVVEFHNNKLAETIESKKVIAVKKGKGILNFLRR